MEAAERFQRKLMLTSTGCRWFEGSRQNGYGQFSVGGRTVKAHRYAYELAYGPIPDGLTVDHECHNRAVAAGTCAGGANCRHRACCEPSHLVLRESWDNTRRGMSPTAINARKTHCDSGHLLPPDRSRCMVCADLQMRAWQAAHPEHRRRRQLCPRCGRERSGAEMTRHLQRCMVRGRKRLDYPRPGAEPCQVCGVWQSKGNMHRHLRQHQWMPQPTLF